MALSIAGAVACVPSHPLELQQGAAVEAGRAVRRPPRESVRWYNDYWRAVSDVNLKMAWILADTPDERRFASALDTIFAGDLGEGESEVSSLLSSRDSVVGSAARLTYDALLSQDGRWARLAAFADSARPRLVDAAGVETLGAAVQRDSHEGRIRRLGRACPARQIRDRNARHPSGRGR